MQTRLLKLRSELPLHLEHRLVTKWGFAVEKRVDSFIIFKRAYVSDKPDDGVNRTIRASVTDSAGTVTVSGGSNVIKAFEYHNGLTLWRRKQLERELENIVNFFPDPKAVIGPLRTRLKIKMQKLTEAEAAFVQWFMDENFPEKGE